MISREELRCQIPASLSTFKSPTELRLESACSVRVHVRNYEVRRSLLGGMPFLRSQLYTVPTLQPNFAAMS